jgi:hypothetical protein
MSDRLALANAIEDAGIERSKAERVASVIFDAIHQHVATKADVQASDAALKADMAVLSTELRTSNAALRAELREGFARQDGAIERLRSAVREQEIRIILCISAVVVVVAGLLFGALHYWPPH